MINRDRFDDWVFLVKAQIIGSTVARLAQDHIAEGGGAPTVADMNAFSEEAVAVAELWAEAGYERQRNP